MPETKVVLTEKDLPTHWYNIQADLPSPLPPVIHPGTKQPIGPPDLAPLFPMELIKQEGVKRITTETGAGQWGSALAFASNAFGLETKKQFEILGEYPDILVGCVGGGSSFAGFTFPFIPAPIHAGGLRYHGMAPLVCALYDQKIIEAVAVYQNPVFEAAVQFTRSEGIVPAPEPSHGIRVVIDEAVRCRERREAKTIAFVLCGHGHFDLGSYQRYLAGQLEDFELPQSAIDEALSLVPKAT